MLDSNDATLPASGARDQWAFRITEAWQKTVNGFIEIGRLLTRAKADLERGEWLPMVEHDLPFGALTAQLLMKIAADEQIANAKHVSLLPPSINALSVITRLDRTGAMTHARLQTFVAHEKNSRMAREPITPSRAGGLTGNRQRRL
jgi:Protein of unknown function (DUF3102)